MQKISKMTDIFIHRWYDNDISKKPISKTPIRYDTDNIDIADIIDDTDTIDPSLVHSSSILLHLPPAQAVDTDDLL